MKRGACCAALVLLAATTATGQGVRFRSAVFLHHSVGGVLWDRSQYSDLTPPTTIPKEIAAYNARLGLTGPNAVSMQETYAPDPSSLNNNDWYRWENIFYGADSYVTLQSLLSSPIVIVKTCYLSQQHMQTADSIAAYQGHIRKIITAMAQHPQTFFVIWNNYPAATDGAADRARWSAQFSVWMKDVLATGADSYGPFPANVYVFDVFRKLADPVSGVCPAAYGSWSEGPGGDHPSNAAVAVVDPAFVDETFYHAILYEHLTSTGPGGKQLPSRPQLNQNYPNPFNPTTSITYEVPDAGHVRLRVFDIAGRGVATLVDAQEQPGTYHVTFDGTALGSGVYLYELQAGSYSETKKMTLLR